MMVFSENRHIKSMSVDDMIALLHIFYQFENFNKNILKYIENAKSYQDIFDLCELCNNRKVLGAKKAKDFYKNNKQTIEIINKYSSASKFISENYNACGVNQTSCINKLYEYLKKHTDEFNSIEFLLLRIKELNFQTIHFDERRDFKNEVYNVETEYGMNVDIVYTENMEAIPIYSPDNIDYTTTSSNYRIAMRVEHEKDKKLVPKEITVNNLTFDLMSLPKTITKEEIFDKILELREEKEDSCISIQDSIDLSVAIDDLCSVFSKTNSIVEKLKSVKSKAQLKRVMSKIKENINTLQLISNNYDKSITKDNSEITKEILRSEKKKYLEKRLENNIDLD